MADKAKARKATIRTQMALTGKVDDALPLWKGARFAATAGLAIAVALITKCADRYPLISEIPGSCAPCVCNEAGVLKGCPYHAELTDAFLWISGRGVTSVEKDAFAGNGGAMMLYLNDNNIETLPDGLFDKFRNVLHVGSVRFQHYLRSSK